MSFFQDLRYAVRLLVKDPWFTTVAATALALGIGVNDTVFTFVNAVLIRGLPFDHPDRIMSLGTRDARNRDRGVSCLEFQDWRAGNRSFVGLAAFSGQTMNVSDEGRAPERFGGAYISANACSWPASPIRSAANATSSFRPVERRRHPGTGAGGTDGRRAC